MTDQAQSVPESEDDKKKLFARIDKNVKARFDAKRKGRGQSQEFIIEQLMLKWVEGDIEI